MSQRATDRSRSTELNGRRLHDRDDGGGGAGEAAEEGGGLGGGGNTSWSATTRTCDDPYLAIMYP